MLVITGNLSLALVLPGGGARGAFQVGVLKAVAELLPRDSANPFGVISGTSAGAVGQYLAWGEKSRGPALMRKA